MKGLWRGGAAGTKRERIMGGIECSDTQLLLRPFIF